MYFQSKSNFFNRTQILFQTSIMESNINIFRCFKGRLPDGVSKSQIQTSPNFTLGQMFENSCEYNKSNHFVFIEKKPLRGSERSLLNIFKSFKFPPNWLLWFPYVLKNPKARSNLFWVLKVLRSPQVLDKMIHYP